LAIGTRLHEFEVRGLIGHGGFSYVYLAQDHSLQRTVALKEYMPASLAVRLSDHSVAARTEHARATFDAGLRSFINEARLLAQFDHAALIKVYRFWEGNGTAYMAMPYYEGTTLKQTIDSHLHVVDESWLKRILAPIVDALEVLHRAHCYHRDISPDNILLLNGGAPLLLDFGAARRIVGGMTQGVTVIVKPGYAPLEQYSGEANSLQGPWTDIYALSAVLYFAITGKAPAPSVARTLSDSLTTLQTRVAEGYSPEFLAAIEHGLAVQPAARPQSMAEFRSALGLSPTQSNAHYDRVASTNLDNSRVRSPEGMREAPFVDAKRDLPATLVSEPPQTEAGVDVSQSLPVANGLQPASRQRLRYSVAIAVAVLFSSGVAYLWQGRSATPDTQPPAEPPSVRVPNPSSATPGAPDSSRPGRPGNGVPEDVPVGAPKEPIGSPMSSPASNSVTHEQIDARLELEGWQAAQRDGTSDAYTRFLTRFPGGRYAEAARAQLLNLRDAVASAKRAAPVRTGIPATAKPSRKPPTSEGASGVSGAGGVAPDTGTAAEPTREQGAHRDQPAAAVPEDQQRQEMERYKRQVEQLQQEKEEAARRQEREETTRQREREEATRLREREEAMKKQPAKPVEVPEPTKKKTPAPFVPSY
jgi:serine/threonine protein kinase